MSCLLLTGMNTRPDLSLRFYNFLCDEFGSPEVIKTRRLFYTALDMVTDSRVSTHIISGSIGEGLAMVGSDLDIMYVNNLITVIESTSANINIKPCTLVKQSDLTKPGFTQLKLCSWMNEIDVGIFCEQCGLDYFMSSERTKLWFLNSLKKSTNRQLNSIHGPCIADENGQFDMAVCIRCKSWISQVNGWLHRSRMWPSADIVSTIESYGVLFVPIGCTNSPHERLEWRISFSVAEKHLIYSFSHTQLLCYALLKHLLKEVIEKNPRLKGLLCSYFWKTILFWLSEELDTSFWTPHNLLLCFDYCFRRLVYCVKYCILPHYFIIDNNLFEDRFSTEDGSNLQTLLFELYRTGPSCLPLFQRFSTVLHPSVPSRYDNLLDQLNTLKALYKRDIFVEYDENICIIIKERLVIGCKLYKEIKHSIMNDFVFSRLCHNMGDLVLSAAACATRNGNKFCYETYKEYIPYVLVGLQTCDVTRWLHLAAYFYSQNQFTFSLKIVDNVLAQCTSDKLFYDDDKFTHEHLQGTANIVYKRSVIDMVSIYNSVTTPHELKTELDFKGLLAKPPVVYGHFLSFLCYFKQNDYRNCQIALTSLKLTIESKYFIRTNEGFAESYNFLGVAYRMLGMLEDARKCFVISIRLHQHEEAYGNFMIQSCKNNN